jgi:hypothetical protein
MVMLIWSRLLQQTSQLPAFKKIRSFHRTFSCSGWCCWAVCCPAPIFCPACLQPEHDAQQTVLQQQKES